MAKLTALRPRQFTNLSRYRIYNQIVDSKTKSVYLESSNNINIVHNGSVYHTVEASEENRLDIISNIYYGTPSLYWAIAMANNIIDPMIVVKGTVLRIPSYESLFVTGGPLIRRG